MHCLQNDEERFGNAQCTDDCQRHS
jgi:hypothetical protein